MMRIEPEVNTPHAANRDGVHTPSTNLHKLFAMSQLVALSRLIAQADDLDAELAGDREGPPTLRVCRGRVGEGGRSVDVVCDPVDGWWWWYVLSPGGPAIAPVDEVEKALEVLAVLLARLEVGE